MQNMLAGIAFLIIGDSHFATNNYLISTLHDGLLKQGAQVETFGACGVPAGAWVASRAVPCGIAEHIGAGPVKEDRSPTAKSIAIDTLIDKYKPNVVIIGIGDTMAGYNQKELQSNWVRENVEDLTSAITAHHLPCIWVGPGWGTEGGPYGKNFKRVKELSEFLAATVAPCTYIDSLTFSKPGEWPTFDGQHYTNVGYEKWGAALTASITDSVAVKALEHH